LRSLVLLLLLAACAQAQPSLAERNRLERLEKGVEVTYANLGRRHTPWHPELLRGVTSATEDYLTRLIYLLDLLVVLRADAAKNLTSGRAPAHYELLFPVVKARLDGLQPPTALAPVHRLVVQAAQDQASFIRDWGRRPGAPPDLEAALVRRSHRRLLQAYDLLLASLPPQETLVLEGLYDPFHALEFSQD
jgi:hypothetical protein